MSLLAIVIALGGALLLLTAGYVFGLQRGREAREALRRQTLADALEISQLREQVAARGDDEGLRAAIRQLLTPLVEREQLAVGLSHLEARQGRRSDLTPLLDQIARVGNFTSVLLADDDGFPLAASSNTRDQERLGVVSSLLLLLSDRMSRDGGAAPLSIMLQDTAGRVTLCRLFQVGDQRLSLTAVATAAHLTPTALDPALAKLGAVLTVPAEA